MSTLLSRNEVCLNKKKRPIASISDNLNDYRVLISDHFDQNLPYRSRQTKRV